MLMKSVTTGLVGSALLASVAFAQTPATTSDKPAAASDKGAAISEQQVKGDWRASKVVGLKVYNDKNENVGSINDLLLDKSGNIKAVVLGVGGFLGVGERLVAVNFDKIKFSDQPVSYTGASNTTNTGAKPASSTTTGSSNTGGSSTTGSSKPNPWYPDHAVFSADKDELQKMQEFKYSTE
jgi:sporulation protein YlmC with PRC-barrel domain